MATLNMVISSNKPHKSGECVVFMQISAKNKTIRVPTEITVRPEWFNKGIVKAGKKGDPLAQIKNIRITQTKNEADQKLINNQEKARLMDVQQLKAFIFSDQEIAHDTDIFHYCDKKIKDLISQDRKKTAHSFDSTQRKIKVFTGNSRLDMNDINKTWLENFEAFCLRPTSVAIKPMTPNGVASYMRYLKWILNDAIAEELIDTYAFKRYKIKTEPTKSRNISIEEVRGIMNFQTDDKRLLWSRDIFILQFLLAGINLKDLFYLRPQDIIDNRLKYYRYKTGRFYNIKIQPEAWDIINKYKGQKYLLFFADKNEIERKDKTKKFARKTILQWKDHEQFGKMVNAGLDKIWKELYPAKTSKITSYFCRHSVATILRSKEMTVDGARIGVSDVAVILGHTEPEHAVTGIYIDEEYEPYDIILRALTDLLLNKPKTDTKAKTKKNKLYSNFAKCSLLEIQTV